MSVKFAHISDVHWRSLKRHDEYRSVFKSMFESLNREKPDVIFIGGDIVHSKTQGITPELIENLTWWFNSLANIAPTHVILGNHDGLILNENRQDAITPIIEALDNDNIYLYKQSGVYPISDTNINWAVFSCFDQKNWDKVEPKKDSINIACFHGAVWGSKTDVDWELDGEVGLDFFDNYDFAFLGDIHKMQYLDAEKRVAYPGSTIQQNYGEDVLKGYMIWEIQSKYDFSSKFINLSNPHPFITIDWKGSVEKTIKFCEKIKKKARFRIRSENSISQAEIKLLHYYLKNDKKAKEIVYQVLSNIPENMSAFNDIKADNNFDIRKSHERNVLLKSLYQDIDDKTLDSLNSVFKSKLEEIPETLSTFKDSWSINSLDFSNTFSYGKDNYINFNSLSGVVGLFGNNRSGKSSIPGTLMYTLFNTSDRGSIKNQDIVNIRKGDCSSSVNISVGSKNYDVTRKTVKKTNKKGITSATTSLELKRNDIDFNETEEQRRETDKILKGLIGTAEDFLYTSFASQGEMNTFIKEKSSARKTVLSKFLSLDVFDSLHKNSREDYIVLKNKLKTISEENWDLLIEDANKDILRIEKEIDLNEEEISNLRSKELNININISNIDKNVNRHPSGYTTGSCKKEIEHIESKIQKNIVNIENASKSLKDAREKLNKISSFKNNHPIENLENDKQKLDNLLDKIKKFDFEKKNLLTKQKADNNEIKILDHVPCGDKFLTCKFIKKAHEAKNNKNTLIKGITELEGSILEIRSVVNKLKDQEIDYKIKKYNNVLNSEYRLKIDLERISEKIVSYKDKNLTLKSELDNLLEILTDLEKTNNDSLIKEIEKHKTDLNGVQDSIFLLERKSKEKNFELFRTKKSIEEIKSRQKTYNSIVSDWKIYDMFTYAVSKKGIPAVLINSCLPRINKEINNILNGVTNFKIEIQEEESNNNLNVYIDYGDSKRIIECASGMEKMIASIAIRVALINVSSLPKSDIFIIDEGFGALDDTNIEACARLLSSLKKYFKSILIISHVDAIKDIVDKNIEISIKGQDSYVEHR